MRICAYEPGSKSMCSPGGRATLNSLMKVATFLFEITVHSHSLTPRIDSSILSCRSFFTFTWQPRRQWSFCCLRVKCTVSVGSISPPPSSTWHLHCPHEPLPPQAEGRCTPASPIDANSVPPAGIWYSLSPFTTTFTSPDATRYFLATNKTMTNRSITQRNTATAVKIAFIIVFSSLD